VKVKARTNGNIVDLPDETARKLIEAGIYDAVADTQQDDQPRRKRATR
jgi:hypothetical protein